VLDLNNASIYPMGIQPALGNNYNIEEDDLGAFLQGDFKFAIGPGTLRGNVGVRYVETEQTSKGYTFTSGSPLQTEVTRKYDDVLPSLNLVYDFSDSLLMRIGAAKVMTRPNLGQLNPGSSVSVSGNSRAVTAGNPDLEPFRADAYDLGFEWYFASESLLSVAVFYKDIESFVQTIREAPVHRQPAGLPDSVATVCGAPWCRVRSAGLTRHRQPETDLPRQAAYACLRRRSSWPVQPAPGAIDLRGVTERIRRLRIGVVTATDSLTGLSEKAYNATLYYDDRTFSARVSAAYRSDYLTTVPGRDNNVEGTASTPTSISRLHDERPLHAHARGAESHGRGAGPVGRLGRRSPVVLSPPGSPVLRGCPFQVLGS
jgi:hypothetical protein